MNTLPSATQQSIQQKISVNSYVMQIVQQYRLGLPQRKHLDNSSFFFILFGIGLVVVLGLFKLMYVSLYTGMPYVTPTGQMVTKTAVDLWQDGWQAVVVFLVLAMASILFGFWLLRIRVFECSEGWFMLSGKQVKQVMYWKDIERTWKTVKKNRMRAGNGVRTVVTVTYFVADQGGKVVTVRDKAIWQRAGYVVANREFARISAPMVAQFHAGNSLAFGAIFIDQQGVHLPPGAFFNQQGWLLPLPAIMKVSISRWLIFTLDPASHLPTVYTPIPPNVDRFVLLLQTISHGRIYVEHENWGQL